MLQPVRQSDQQQPDRADRLEPRKIRNSCEIRKRRHAAESGLRGDDGKLRIEFPHRRFERIELRLVIGDFRQFPVGVLRDDVQMLFRSGRENGNRPARRGTAGTGTGNLYRRIALPRRRAEHGDALCIQFRRHIPEFRGIGVLPQAGPDIRFVQDFVAVDLAAIFLRLRPHLFRPGPEIIWHLILRLEIGLRIQTHEIVKSGPGKLLDGIEAAPRLPIVIRPMPDGTDPEARHHLRRQFVVAPTVVEADPPVKGFVRRRERAQIKPEALPVDGKSEIQRSRRIRRKRNRIVDFDFSVCRNFRRRSAPFAQLVSGEIRQNPGDGRLARSRLQIAQLQCGIDRCPRLVTM
ncbi:hypothetical protein SDC9_127533 [bioreactor metagenome]|uniref:Uncharacterized protein n=1 Tax=bioreactor metagenome TaxID=1076179 RepID=A0A645CTP5_9ZZZZ